MPSTTAGPLLSIALVSVSFLGALPAIAQEEAETPRLGLSNTAELSAVVTAGNSETQTLGLKNLLAYDWPEARYTLRLEAVRSEAAGEPFAELVPDAPPGDQLVLVEPPKEVDVEKYRIENIFQRNLSERLFWNVGLAWDRNEDAGLLNRYVGFAGVGHTWRDEEDLRFATSYGLSFTDREEVSDDPEKDGSFVGFRFGWTYRNAWGAVTTFGNDLAANVNVSDTNDWTGEMTNWVAVAMNSRIALKVSLQWLYNNLPALQEIDLVGLDADGSPVELGTLEVRKDELDTIFSTSIVIAF